jgi:hypothetical protein
MNQKIHNLRMTKKARRLGIVAAALLLALAPTPLHGTTPHVLAYNCPC